MVAAQEVLLPLVGAVLLAGQALFLRLATREGRVSDVLVVVLVVNIGLLVPFAAVYSYPDYGLTTRSVLAFVAAGLIGTVFGRLALFTGIQRIGASRAEPLKASNPLFAAIVAVAVLGERMTTEHFLGVVLIVVGVAVVSWEQASGSETDELGSVADLGFPLLAALFFAIEPTVAKIGLNEGTPVFVGLAIKTAAAAVGYVGYLRWRGALPTVGVLSDGGFRWYLAAGLANTAFLVALYVSLSIAPVVLVAPLVQASPLFVVVLSYVFLQDIERVTARLALGVAVVVGGGALVAIYG
jgi:drug/metabolite transporter (DMT)-like permease